MENKNVKKGSFYALIAFFFMALFGVLTKLAIQGGSVLWVSFITYLTGSIFLIPYIYLKGFDYLKSERYTYLLGRAVFGSMASFLYTISIHYIPIINGTLLFNTAPIFIPILAMTFFKAKIRTSIWMAVAIGFIGILVIIGPNEQIFTQAGNLIGLASGMSLAVAYLLMKILTNTDPGIRIIFYYLGIGTLIQMPLLLFAGSFPILESFFYAAVSGLMLLSAQILLVKAYTYAEASEVGIYQYSSVAFVGLFDWFLWRVVPSIFEIAGILLVTLAGIIIIRSGSRTKSSEKII